MCRLYFIALLGRWMVLLSILQEGSTEVLQYLWAHFTTTYTAVSSNIVASISCFHINYSMASPSVLRCGFLLAFHNSQFKFYVASILFWCFCWHTCVRFGKHLSCDVLPYILWNNILDYYVFSVILFYLNLFCNICILQQTVAWILHLKCLSHLYAYSIQLLILWIIFVSIVIIYR